MGAAVSRGKNKVKVNKVYRYCHVWNLMLLVCFGYTKAPMAATKNCLNYDRSGTRTQCMSLVHSNVLRTVLQRHTSLCEQCAACLASGRMSLFTLYPSTVQRLDMVRETVNIASEIWSTPDLNPVQSSISNLVESMQIPLSIQWLLLHYQNFQLPWFCMEVKHVVQKECLTLRYWMTPSLSENIWCHVWPYPFLC